MVERRGPLDVRPAGHTEFERPGQRVGDREHGVDDERDASGRPDRDPVLAAHDRPRVELERLAPLRRTVDRRVAYLTEGLDGRDVL